MKLVWQIILISPVKLDQLREAAWDTKWERLLGCDPWAMSNMVVKMGNGDPHDAAFAEPELTP